MAPNDGVLGYMVDPESLSAESAFEGAGEGEAASSGGNGNGDALHVSLGAATRGLRGVRAAVASSRRTRSTWLRPVLSLLDGIQQGWAAAAALAPRLGILAVGSREGSITVLNFAVGRRSTARGLD